MTPLQELAGLVEYELGKRPVSAIAPNGYKVGDHVRLLIQASGFIDGKFRRMIPAGEVGRVDAVHIGKDGKRYYDIFMLKTDLFTEGLMDEDLELA